MLSDANPGIAAPVTTETSLDRQLAYLVLRLTMGVSILLHGLLPLSHLNASVAQIVQLFAKAPLPTDSVRLFAIVVPFAQTAIGLLLIVGLWTRLALAGGGFVMAALVFGTALRGDGQGLGILMLYALIYYQLLAAQAYNRFSTDRLRGRIAHPFSSKH